MIHKQGLPMQFNISVNQNIINKLPEEGADWKTANGGFVNTNVSLNEFANSIKHGYAWCNPHKSYRDRKNFLEGWAIGVDIDKGNSTLEDIMSIPLVNKHAGIVHTTPSHTIENPRYRIIFILSSPIKNRHKFESVVDSIITSFQTITTDTACKDAMRLFYGSKDCEIIVRDKFLPLAIAVFKYAKPYLIKQEEKRLAYLEKIKNHKVHYNGATPQHLLEAVKNSLVDTVLSSTDGNKAFMLNKAAYTAGGYVAGSYFDELEIKQCLYEAIASKPNVRSLDVAEKIIEKGIRKGMNQPLIITEEPDEFELLGLI